MPFSIVRNDITLMHCDAIVNTANPRPVIGTGIDTAIHAAAGSGLLEARKKIGRIKAGASAITPAFQLDAKYVIHTVGPVWRGGLFGEEKLLRSCYASALKLAAEHGCKTIALPLISTGNYRFPKDKALQIAIAAFSEFLLEQEMEIYLVIWGEDTLRLSEKLFHQVSSFIDENYIKIAEEKEYDYIFLDEYPETSRHQNKREKDIFGQDWDEFCKNLIHIDPRPSTPARRRDDFEDLSPSDAEPVFFGEGSADSAPCYAEPECYADSSADFAPCYSAPVPVFPSTHTLRDMLKQEDAGFSETLLKLIDKSGHKDSAIYKKACLSKQHFSKIRNNPDYKPTKATALSLAIALELDLEQTKDLIGRAGYALTNSSKFDLIIRYFIEQKIYNVVDINIALYEFDQSLLGG